MTEEEQAEKKRAQRKVKREKEKEKRKEQEVKKIEEEDRNRFLKLSDREKVGNYKTNPNICPAFL